MVEVLEPLCHGREHASFNAALLETACVLADGSRIIFHGEPDHLEAVREALPITLQQRVEWNAVMVPPRHLRKWIPRFISDLFLLFSVFGRRTPKSRFIVKSSVTEAGLLADKLFFFFISLLNPSLRVIIVFHSILPWFLYNKKRRLYLQLFRPRCMKFVVLGEHIVQNVEKSYPDMIGLLSPIPHPYSFPSQEEAPIQGNSAQGGIGFIGIGNRAKGFPEFLRVIERTADLPPTGNSKKFHMIGRVAGDCETEYENFLSNGLGDLLSSPFDEMVSLEQYRMRINQVDYLMMPYQASFYDFVCSGSSLDAFLYLRPIIALRSTYFQELFNRHGDIGYLCNDVDEMARLTSRLLMSSRDSRWLSQVNNLYMARSFFSSKTVANDLQKLFL